MVPFRDYQNTKRPGSVTDLVLYSISQFTVAFPVHFLFCPHNIVSWDMGERACFSLK